MVHSGARHKLSLCTVNDICADGAAMMCSCVCHTPIFVPLLFVPSECGIPFQVVAAIDINPTANQIYRGNFPNTPLWNKTIEVGCSGRLHVITGAEQTHHIIHGVVCA